MLKKKRFKRVVGLDEVGRGTLAGPVLACAVFFSAKPLKDLKDSKKLSPKKREEFFRLLTKDPNVRWGIGRVSERVIDRINILEASKLAMERAVKNLKLKPDFLILDGNFSLKLPIAQKAIVKADEKVPSCSAASIIAKVSRDRLMVRLSRKYPQYGFERHKGYPTRLHKARLKRHGVSQIHRKSFKLA